MATPDDVREAFAAPKVDDRILKQVAKLTDANDHTGARILLATKVLKNRKIASIYDHIGEISSLMGYLPSELDTLRYYVDKNMLKKALNQKGLEAYWGAL